METPMLEDTPRDSSRVSRVRAFLPRGMGDRDVTGARSGPLGSIAAGGAEAAAAAAAAATASARSAAPAVGLRRGDSGALSALRSGSGSAGSGAAPGGARWPKLAIPVADGGGHDGDGDGGRGSGGGGDGGGYESDVRGGGGEDGSGGGGGGGGGGGPLRRGMSAMLGRDGSMRRTETGHGGGLIRKLSSSPRPPSGPGDWAALDLARQMTAERLGAAETRIPVGEPDKAGKDEDEQAKADAKAAKEKKELQKKIKDYMKTALSSERTFFKWIWTTLNLGALGTFALAFFHDDGFPYRLIVVAVAWMMGLFFALYGLLQFHRRRKALLSVTDDPETWESPQAPAIVVAAFVLMLVTIIVYAIASGQQFGFRTRAELLGSTIDQ